MERKLQWDLTWDLSEFNLLPGRSCRHTAQSLLVSVYMHEHISKQNKLHEHVLTFPLHQPAEARSIYNYLFKLNVWYPHDKKEDKMKKLLEWLTFIPKTKCDTWQSRSYQEITQRLLSLLAGIWLWSKKIRKRLKAETLKNSWQREGNKAPWWGVGRCGCVRVEVFNSKKQKS